MTFDEWWQMPYGALDIVSASGSVNVKMIAKGAWNAALKFAQQPQGEICPHCSGGFIEGKICDVCFGICQTAPRAADVG